MFSLITKQQNKMLWRQGKLLSLTRGQTLKNEESWPAILQEYIQLSASYGVVSDDECLAVASTTGITPAQINAQLREMDVLSDNVWHREVNTQSKK
jgi:hypothetical protein